MLMIGKEQEGTRLASVYEVKDILEEKKEAMGELGYEQKLAYEYATKFAKLGKSDVTKLRKELDEFKLLEKTVMKLIEVMPVDINQLRLMLVSEKRNFEDEELKKILAVVDGYRGK